MFWFVLFEILIIIACIWCAKKMVEKRIIFANPKLRTIGGDDEQTIKKMQDIATDIILTRKFEMTEENEIYDVQIRAKEKCIEKVVIQSPATKVTFHYLEGWKTEKLSYTEKGSIAEIAVMLWLIVFVIQLVVVVIAFLVWLNSLIH